MFDINKYPEIILFLQNLSPNMFKKKFNEIMMFCPFCDDATRKSGYINHGHCYIGIDKPVFNCFRCGTSGNLIKLLVLSGFDDHDVLKELSQYHNHQFSKNYFKLLTNKNKSKNIINNITHNNINFYKNNKELYDIYMSYIYKRIGEVIFPQFLFYPNLKNNIISINFLNYDGNLSTTRFINDPKRRYKNADNNQPYYFQEFDFSKYNRIVLTEGVFDAISLYCYNNNFNINDTIFISVNGKKYLSIIERLIFQYILLGSYEINLIFDDDVYNYKSFLYKAKLYTSLYNNNISIIGWKPLLENIESYKDVGDFPAIREITNE